MSSARPVRLARPNPAGPGPPAEATAVAPPIPPAPRVERRANTFAARRARFLALLYVAGVAALFGALAGVARAGPRGGSSGVTGELLLFGGVAAVVALVGALVALGSAPRELLLSERATIVVRWWGHRVTLPERSRLRVSVLRRVPAGVLGGVAIETVEILGGKRRTTLSLDEGLLDPPPDR